MKNKAILVSFVALFAMILTLSIVSATDFVSVDKIYVNGVDTGSSSSSSTTYIGEVSNTIPVEVQFTAHANVSDRVKVKVSIEGYKDDIEQYIVMDTPLYDTVSGYVGRLSLKLPSSMDFSDLSDSTTLHVEIYTKEDSVTAVRNIRMSRDLYSLNILSVDASDMATAGSTVDFNVVLQNNGNNRLDNVYVKASIPELGIERKVYFGDLKPTVEGTYEDIRDTTERKVYLTIPSNAAPGTYNVQVEAYNYDVSTTATKKLQVTGLQSGVIPTSNANTVAIGKETTFNLVLVNPNDKMIVYSITPDTSEGLLVSVDQPVVAIPAGSSKTVQVTVKATSAATQGTHLVTVNVNSDSGLVKQVSYSVTVESSSTSNTTPTGAATSVTANGVLILTVVLVIIFVVLLIVLIVLLTRKPAETEEFGETSYY
jgi:uncharacterized repeat protein (TIGR01451 family)